MTLEVPFTEFVSTVKRTLGDADVYVVQHARGTLTTAADPTKNLVVASVNLAGLDATKTAVEAGGCICYVGSWFDPESPSLASGHQAAFIGAVAYKSSEPMPGVWVDAYESMPTQVTVLRTMYEEFKGTGEIGDMTFEDFVSTANPNVVIVAPHEIQSFIDSKLGC